LIDATLGYAHSFGGHTEFSLLMPYGMYSTGTGSGAVTYAGSRGITGILKHSFTDPVYAQGTAFAFTLMYSLYPGQASTNITSGETLQGLEFNLSHWAQTTGFHLNLGYGHMEAWSESALPPFVATEMLTASTGVEVGVSDAMTFSLQALAKQEITTKNENLLASAVFTYSVSKHTIFTFGGAWGIPSNRSRPNSSLIFGISYSPQAKRKTRYEIKGSGEQLEAQNQEILQKVDDIDQRMERLESSMTAKSQAEPEAGVSMESGMQRQGTDVRPEMESAAVPVTGGDASTSEGLNVELVMPGGKNAHERAITNTLRNAGFIVTIRHEAGGPRPNRTHIFYQAGMSEQAVKLGHVLKGNQIVVRHDLPEGVDIRVDVGKDLAP
jgi:hypothetical protein